MNIFTRFLKKVCLFLILSFLFSGCTGDSASTDTFSRSTKPKITPGNASSDEKDTFREQSTPEPESKADDFLTIDFAGDLCLCEDWYTLNKYDYEDGVLSKCISQELTDILNAADIFMLNNEFTFSDRGTALEGKYYTFRAATSRINILNDLGVDTVSLANNHIYDFGADAFFDTLDTLHSANITTFGGGADLNEAVKPVYYDLKNIKVGFVAATCAEKIRYTPEATDSSPGVLLAYDDTKYLQVIREAKANCDFLVAYIHWGNEDTHEVTNSQKNMGREFIDAGADIVIGGHPHVLQGIEYYNGKPIVYSLGDFWFNDETKETGIIEIKVSDSGLQNMKFLPCMQENLTTTLKTAPDERRRIFDFLQDISFGITIDNEGKIGQS